MRGRDTVRVSLLSMREFPTEKALSSFWVAGFRASGGCTGRADVEDRLLTTLEITLEGETVRWEKIDEDRGELIEL